MYAILLAAAVAAGGVLMGLLGAHVFTPMGYFFLFRSFPVITKELLADGGADNPSVWRIGFALRMQTDILGLNAGLGEHIKVKLPVGYECTSAKGSKPRSYSPSSAMDKAGYFELTVKEYPLGCASKYLGSLQVGQSVSMSRGWPLPAPWMMKRSAGRYVGIISLGIGITDAVWVAHAELLKGTQYVTLLRANKWNSDVMHEEVAALMEEFPSRFTVRDIYSQEIAIPTMTLSEPSSVSSAAPLYGRVNTSVIDSVFRWQHLHPKIRKEDVRFMCVGTKTMKKSLYDLLTDMGYPFEKHALLIKQILPRF